VKRAKAPLVEDRNGGRARATLDEHAVDPERVLMATIDGAYTDARVAHF
jgi:hypothetical protein